MGSIATKAYGKQLHARSNRLVQDTLQYLIKLERPYSLTETPYSIVVYERRDEGSQKEHQLRLMAELGTDPDQPGTELLAYLDNCSFEELTNLIDYLRDPYKSENVVYLHHAIQAIQRKKGFETWLHDLPEVRNGNLSDDPLWPIDFHYVSLSSREREDRLAIAYDFAPNSYWAEVKASNPPAQPFQEDLFNEQLLNFPPEQLPKRDQLEPDDASTDFDGVRELQRQGRESLYAIEKPIFLPENEDSEDVDCAEFTEILMQLKGLEGKTVAEVEEAIGSIKISDDETLSDCLAEAGASIKAALEFMEVLGVVEVTEPIAAQLIRIFPKLGGRTVLGSPLLIAIARFVPYLGIIEFCAEMFWKPMEENAKAMEAWKQAGKRTAVRQWARALDRFVDQNQANFPDKIEIDIGHDVRVSYHREKEAEGYSEYVTILYDVDSMQEGFDEAIPLIERLAQENLSKSQRIVDDYLQQSGLDACKIRALWQTGILDVTKCRALVMRHLAREILKQTPKV